MLGGKYVKSSDYEAERKKGRKKEIKGSNVVSSYTWFSLRRFYRSNILACIHDFLVQKQSRLRLQRFISTMVHLPT